MKHHLKFISSELSKLNKDLNKDQILTKDIDTDLHFIPPFSGAKRVLDVKLVFIGQDPTIRNVKSRAAINTTLNLDKNGSLKNYLNYICDKLSINLEEEVYATNLYKCFFTNPPADDPKILKRHFKLWMDLLFKELSVFENPLFISLGDPLLNQLTYNHKKKVKHFWDYRGNTKSGGDFEHLKCEENYLQKNIFPFPHQPAYSRIKFYRNYIDDYLKYTMKN